MSKTISITASKREVRGSAHSRQLRSTGVIPAVVYSRGVETQLVQVSEADARKVAHHAGLVELTGADGVKQDAILKEIQLNPLTGKPLSVDFLEVKAGEKVTMTVPVEPTGDPEGLKQGGQLEQVIHTLDVTGEPANIPEVILVDVSKLELNQAMAVSEIKLDGLKISGNLKQIVFHVRIPHNQLAEPEAAATEAATAEGAAAAPAAGAPGAAAPAAGAAAPAAAAAAPEKGKGKK